jgi:hypothetical protein
MQSSRKVGKDTPGSAKTAATAIELNQGEIAKKAFDLNIQHKSYDDYIWLLAESETRLSRAYLSDMKAHGVMIKIDTSRIDDKPAEKEIRSLAADLASKKPKAQDVHWLIAERQYILDAARSKK